MGLHFQNETATFALRFVSLDFNHPGTMSVTRLKRKHRKNIARANNKQHIIKELLRTPVLKNVDIEELKSRFTTTGGVAGVAATVKNTAAAAVDKVEEVASTVANSNIVEQASAAVSSAVDKVKEVVGGAVDSVKEAVSGTDNTAADNAESFDDAEAVTKPVNEDGQEGEHPKPEIAL
jgi:hypothetical protein